MKISRMLIPIAIAILSLHPAPAAAAPGQQLDIWTWRNPLPTGNPLNSVTHGIINGNGMFVAVGVNGTIVTSPDGINWDQQVGPAPNASLSAVVYGSGEFVAVGADAATPPNNVILTSPDGTNWSPNAQLGGIGTGGLLAVVYDGNGNFMAVGINGTNLYWSGGLTWTPNPAIAAGTDFYGVAYGVYNGAATFVAAGTNGSIFYSTTHGASWTASTVNGSAGSFNGIAFGNNTFVVVGQASGFFYSPDGGKSFDLSTNEYFFGDSVQYVYVERDSEYEFVVANILTYYPSILTSSNGIHWIAYSEPPWLFNAIACDGSGTFVGVGPGGGIATNLTDITSASDWGSVVTSGSWGSLYAITYGTTASDPGANFFVAGGAGTGQTPAVVWSLDGYTWVLDTDPSIDNEFQFYNSFITGLAYGTINNNPPAFVATVNTYQGTLGAASVIISSTNFSLLGPIWTLDHTNKPNVLNGVTCGVNGSGQSLFVAVGGSNTVVRSTNPSVPSSWTSPNTPPPATSTSSLLEAVAYGGGSFVAVGMNGVIFCSSDGGANTWNPPTTVSPPTSADFYGVAYGTPNGSPPLFVVVGSGGGSGGVIYTSINGGQTWTQQTSFTFTPPTAAPPPFSGVTFANGLFVAVTGGVSGGGFFVSRDGVNWKQSSTATPGSLNAVASGNGQYIAVGGGAAILGSVLAAVSNGQYFSGGLGGISIFSFTVCGPPGTFGVYVSNDFIHWNFFKNETFGSSPTTDCQTIYDLNAGNYTEGYYYLGAPQ